VVVAGNGREALAGKSAAGRVDVDDIFIRNGRLHIREFDG